MGAAASGPHPPPRARLQLTTSIAVRRVGLVPAQWPDLSCFVCYDTPRMKEYKLLQIVNGAARDSQRAVGTRYTVSLRGRTEDFTAKT